MLLTPSKTCLLDPSYRSWLPPAVTPPSSQAAARHICWCNDSCSVMDSHTADSVPRKQEHTWRGDTAALKPTPVSSLQLPLQMPSGEAPDMRDALAALCSQ